jgi:gamma-glutamylcyclotransferase (GGCT)/AIG2-like uncharacterized protein YtfP
MPKKIQDCTKAHLISIDLPVHGDSYTVISHQSVMDYVFTELATAGFVVTTEEYRATADGQIAQGIYKLNYNNDPELNMMFAWTNSYNKQVRFKCGVGAYINNTGTVMVCGDMGSWARKHTGTADTETIATIKEQIAGAQMYYDQLVSDKEQMKTIVLNKRRQAQMLGILFAEYQIITTEQASMIRNQMDRPSHVYDDSNSLWAFYNYVTIALQHSHPKTWMEDQRVLHYFMSSINNFAVAPAPVVVPVVIEAEVETIDPNQISLLDQIEEMETNKVEETLITYTDPAGNTFEAIEFHNEVTADSEEEEKIAHTFATMSLSLTPDEILIMESEDKIEHLDISDANLDTLEITIAKEEEELMFDLDINMVEEEEDQEDSDIPDFF